MKQNSAFDYVLLGVYINDIWVGGTLEDALRVSERLQEMGLSKSEGNTRDYVRNNVGMDDGQDISQALLGFVHDELKEQENATINASVKDVHLSSEKLIETMSPGVWAWLPSLVQDGFIDAEKCFQNGLFDGMAFYLGRSVEMMVKHFHEQITGESSASLSWSEIENRIENMARQGRPELFASLDAVSDIRIYDRNPITHGGKILDRYDAVSLWHSSVKAISRMARVLLERFPLPKQE
ncbi:MAG: hypothetical protein NT023_10670 [Armatimonadetes bacterium]|nr:hypothetical protein [Armatimonadota bacterium]